LTVYCMTVLTADDGGCPNPDEVLARRANSMKSPFPGMDPYLESRWGDVHSRMAVLASNQLRTQLPADLRARVHEALVVEGPDERRARRISPDVGIIERPWDPGSAPSPSSVAIAEPLVVTWDEEPMVQRSVQIIDSRAGNRLVTAIEFLSRANKADPVGRDAYLRKQHDVLAAGANLVEIDLIRGRNYILRAPEDIVPDEYLSPYRVCVSRGGFPGRAELYRVQLRTELPTILIPLRQSDKDVWLKLQQLIEHVYVDGAYDDIDYTEDPSPPLNGEDAAWADQMLRQQGKR
jgi:hypothetical protein